jgi:hypothetical protein
MFLNSRGLLAYPDFPQPSFCGGRLVTISSPKHTFNAANKAPILDVAAAEGRTPR